MKSRKIIFTTVLSALVCFGLMPGAKAVEPAAPDTALAGGNTAYGQSALGSLTTGQFNSAFGFFSLLLLTDASFDTVSYNKYQEGYFLTRESMKWFWNNYLPNGVNRKEPTISPLQASTEQLQGLPPALILSVASYCCKSLLDSPTAITFPSFTAIADATEND